MWLELMPTPYGGNTHTQKIPDLQRMPVTTLTSNLVLSLPLHVLVVSFRDSACAQVSKNFSDVFKELVPDGKAQLIMKRAVDVVSTILHFGGDNGWDTAFT